MYMISDVNISGFWGDRQLSTSIHPDVNFFIGTNGSGKTTAINIIAAALNADLRTLDTLSFDKISIKLQSTPEGKKTSIEVVKEPSEKFPFPDISYSIDGLKYSLNTYEEQLRLREYAVRPQFRQVSRRTPRPDMIEHLKRLVNVSWLSIHRSDKSRPPFTEQRSYESTVDQKLDDLSREFAGFLSQLNRQGENETSKFQQQSFLSLISRQTSRDLASAFKTMDLTEEKHALEDIFTNFNIDSSVFSPDVDKHFKSVESAQKDLEKKSSKISVNAVISLITMLRIHLVVKEWKALISRHNEIFEPRETFLRIMNELVLGKKIEINDRNQFFANAGPNKIFTLHQLSSGEKQLFIILGEALLQHKTPWIYIADEPELSLHVSWQSRLIDSLRQINPNAQIIFATHSPDIVSHYDSKEIKMEDIIK